MNNKRISIIGLLLVFAPLINGANAADLDNLAALDQAQFRVLSEDLTASLAYKGVQPTEPYGVIGYDISGGASHTRFSDEGVWRLAGGDGSSVSFARLGVTKGLPFGFDAGAYLARQLDGDLSVLGAQLRYALHEGGVLTPAVGLRASVTRLQGADDLNMSTRGLDLSISKGFGPATPYAGIGRVWSDADPASGTGLAEESLALTRSFAGVRFSAVVLQLTLEVERVGDVSGYAANFGFMF